MLLKRKILEKTEEMEYFTGLPIRPGIEFFQKLGIIIGKSEPYSDLKNIKMRIADTIVFSEGDYYWIYTSKRVFIYYIYIYI